MNLILPEKNRSDLDDSKKWCEFKMKLVRAREGEMRQSSARELLRAADFSGVALGRALPHFSLSCPH